MFRKYLLPVLAAVMLILAVYHVVGAQQEKPKLAPPREPARAPFAHTVAGAGLVEAESENIAVGSPLPGVVAQVHVRVGETVKAGAPLFALDDRQLQAELKVRRANLAAAEAQLTKQVALPRPEEVPPSSARVREAEANLADMEDLLKRARRLFAQRAISEEEAHRREQAALAARAQLERVRADHALLQAGAWQADKDIAYAAVLQAKSQAEQTQTELERLVVRAPVDGEILKLDVRPGEYVGTPPGLALIVLGNVRQLHVRVDIDENDIPRFRPGAPARAMLRGNPQLTLPLRFVRVEPYVVPKRSLTGDNTERVDTRVLQVIYAIAERTYPVYVGQQLDVFLDADTAAVSRP